jgi:hypothetical protein
MVLCCFAYRNRKTKIPEAAALTICHVYFIFIFFIIAHPAYRYTETGAFKKEELQMGYNCIAVMDKITGNIKRVNKVLRTLNDPRHGVMARFRAVDVVKGMVIGEAASQKVRLSNEEIDDVTYAVIRDIKKKTGMA